ncbi:MULTISPECIES: hypothetical protein [Flavobacterium]|uniref:Uncharacterized protein n=1 Tax=Flavobacterium collinsii TaxID=1114861 RepID=A0A9W4TLP0_9FLAO|nr:MULTISPECIES: hypothetical protein [Flavobacterium]URC12613.1 hypothetical protein M4I44_21395 [Flavobacterium sp. B183]CAI2769215.1 conserved protein of unknown function [Flavobacterium collinsii]
MKLSTYGFLILGILFGIGFITSLFKDGVQELFFFVVHIWVYRIYKLIFSFLFIYAYFRIRAKERKV